MGRSFTRSEDIVPLLAHIVRPSPDQAAQEAFVLLCQRMAAAYVRVKVAGSAFDPSRLGLSASDFAFDAIADLFRRDDKGCFPTFAGLFSGTPAGTRPGEEVERLVRHLVFTAVDRHIFRSYRDSDPMLAKLLRNIKLTLRTHPLAEIVEIRGELMVVPRCRTTIHEHLPVLPSEIMEAEVAARLPGVLDLREMLSALVSVLAEQTDHSRRYPVMGVAMIFRSIYARSAAVEPDVDPIDGMTDEELERFLRPALGKVLQRTGRKYIEDGKISERELQIYARALFDMILDRFTRRESETTPLFSHVMRHDPSVTQQEYSDRHRAILEYLLKLVHRELKELLQEEWEFLR